MQTHLILIFGFEPPTHCESIWLLCSQGILTAILEKSGRNTWERVVSMHCIDLFCSLACPLPHRLCTQNAGWKVQEHEGGSSLTLVKASVRLFQIQGLKSHTDTHPLMALHQCYQNSCHPFKNDTSFHGKLKMCLSRRKETSSSWHFLQFLSHFLLYPLVFHVSLHEALFPPNFLLNTAKTSSSMNLNTCFQNCGGV